MVCLFVNLFLSCLKYSFNLVCLFVVRVFVVVVVVVVVFVVFCCFFCFFCFFVFFFFFLNGQKNL